MAFFFFVFYYSFYKFAERTINTHKLIETSNQVDQVLSVGKRYCKASQKKSYEKRKYCNLQKVLFILLEKVFIKEK